MEAIDLIVLPYDLRGEGNIIRSHCPDNTVKRPLYFYMHAPKAHIDRHIAWVGDILDNYLLVRFFDDLNAYQFFDDGCDILFLLRRDAFCFKFGHAIPCNIGGYYISYQRLACPSIYI